MIKSFKELFANLKTKGREKLLLPAEKILKP